MKKATSIVFLLLLSSFYLVKCLGLAKITVGVQDESGEPIENAAVEAAFNRGHLKSQALLSRTDPDGKCSVLSTTPDGTVVGRVTKPLFYDSTLHEAFFAKGLGFWKPWNKKVTVVLRPILHPVRMYVRNRAFNLPVAGKKVGLDLMAGDWVAPYGKGTHSDFLMEVQREHQDVNNFYAFLKISFANRHDGIQSVNDGGGDVIWRDSAYRLPRTAPAIGYQDEFVKQVSQGVYGYRFSRADGMGFIFRVRSESDSGGALVRAIYGKILGDIAFDPLTGKNGAVRMHYFLNPDYSRNLEFNPKYNLAPDLSQYERVEVP